MRLRVIAVGSRMPAWVESGYAEYVKRLSRDLPLPAGIMPEPMAQNGEPQNGVSSLHLPSDADIDRMVTFMDHVWHRFVDAVERAQKQVLNRS